MKQRKHISDDKKICIILNSFLSTVVSDLKIPNHCNYFFAKKNTFSHQLSLKRLKNTPVFLILNEGILIQFFHSERLLKRRY